MSRRRTHWKCVSEKRCGLIRPSYTDTQTKAPFCLRAVCVCGNRRGTPIRNQRVEANKMCNLLRKNRRAKIEESVCGCLAQQPSQRRMRDASHLPGWNKSQTHRISNEKSFRCSWVCRMQEDRLSYTVGSWLRTDGERPSEFDVCLRTTYAFSFLFNTFYDAHSFISSTHLTRQTYNIPLQAFLFFFTFWISLRFHINVPAAFVS